MNPISWPISTVNWSPKIPTIFPSYGISLENIFNQLFIVPVISPISIFSTSTYRRPNKLEFLGMPRYYHENELNELIDFQTCQTCFLPKTNLDITCKRCIREIHKSGGALPLHALSIGCLEGRCNCTDGPSRTFDFDFDTLVDY